ncbi:hypothetical protein [Gynurincola endophyticus]|uniref:hypothetical protein n=1 Tax=Gynurincola endophyticus TaxID=2479004 RepID=UPI000F8EAB27|nr:hypothetical protein [Gynurincola endophyticus]
MKVNLFFIIVIIMFGCSDNKKLVYYNFNNIWLTRIDDGGNSKFFYGIVSDLSIDENFNVDYFGINNGMQAYFIFDSDSSICIIPVMGEFKQIKKDDKFRVCNYTNLEFILLTDSISGNYKNTLFISNILSLERTHNAKNKSSVTIIDKGLPKK